MTVSGTVACTFLPPKLTNTYLFIYIHTSPTSLTQSQISDCSILLLVRLLLRFGAEPQNTRTDIA